MYLPDNLKGKHSLTLKKKNYLTIKIPSESGAGGWVGGAYGRYSTNPHQYGGFVFFILTKSGQDFPTVLFLQI